MAACWIVGASGASSARKHCNSLSRPSPIEVASGRSFSWMTSAASSPEWASRAMSPVWRSPPVPSPGDARPEIDLDALTRGNDVTARPVATSEGMLYFAALGDRVAGVGDAVRAVHRILAETRLS